MLMLVPTYHAARTVVSRSRETAITIGFAVGEEIVTLVSGEDVYAEAEANRWRR